MRSTDDGLYIIRVFKRADDARGLDGRVGCTRALLGQGNRRGSRRSAGECVSLLRARAYVHVLRDGGKENKRNRKNEKKERKKEGRQEKK